MPAAFVSVFRFLYFPFFPFYDILLTVPLRKDEIALKTWQKIVFIVVLIFFVSVSITISLISVSRDPYKYKTNY